MKIPKSTVKSTVAEYRRLLKDFKDPDPGTLSSCLDCLDSSELAVFSLYIASGCKIGLTANLLHTNAAFCRKMVDEIRTKVIANINKKQQETDYDILKTF